MSDNYLALQDWEKFQTYFDLYRSNESQIKFSERNTIHNILNNHFSEVEAKKNLKLKYVIPIVIGLLLLILTIYSMIRSEVKFKGKLIH